MTGVAEKPRLLVIDRDSSHGKSSVDFLSESFTPVTVRTISKALALLRDQSFDAVISTQVLEHLVWGVKTLDPATYLGVAFGIVLVAGLASLLPALRITKLSPAETLRDE